MAHVGLLPQQVEPGGSFEAKGRLADDAIAIAKAALELERAGCFSIGFEAIPAEVRAAITAKLRIPSIGIGAGSATDGQVLVFHDLVGLSGSRLPRFVKQYSTLPEPMTASVRAYAAEVRARQFSTEAHTYAIAPDQLRAFREKFSKL
jgi:3-methyl-2-oxobutanoate hydroxymethyltransferase